MTIVRLPLIVFALLAWCVGAPTARRCCAQGSRTDGIEIATIDANTRWALRSLSPVTVSSAIVRLGDVVKPLDPNMAGWQRLRHSPIGLVPIGGHPMTIDRDRLAQAIRDAEATPLVIDWVGPTEIRVEFQRNQTPTATNPTNVAQVAYNQPAATPAGEATSHHPILAASVAERVVYWIELALKRQHPSVTESHQIEIDRSQPGLHRLGPISGVTEITSNSEIDEGACHFHVVGRSPDGPIESVIEITLTRYPSVVVPRTTLARGKRITASDLTVQPIPGDKIESAYVVDPEDIIGLEARGTLRAGRPIKHSEVGSPILVHRGDLIEVRVMGGGVTVTTSAKSLSNGAASELVEIETTQPRKRLVARVVQAGLVEIVTRAPIVHGGQARQ